MIKGIVNFFTTPSRARTFVIIALIILLLLIIYWWRSSRKRRQQEKQFQDDYKQLTEGSGQKPTYISTNYTQYADKIYAAGCSGAFCWGTDEQAIYDVFDKMQNDLDVLLLSKAFGLREPRGEFCTPLDKTCDFSLGEWLQTELGSDEFTEINNILSKKGIKHKF